MVELVAWGSVINGAYPIKFFLGGRNVLVWYHNLKMPYNPESYFCQEVWGIMPLFSSKQYLIKSSLHNKWNKMFQNIPNKDKNERDYDSYWKKVDCGKVKVKHTFFHTVIDVMLLFHVIIHQKNIITLIAVCFPWYVNFNHVFFIFYF